MERLSGGSQQIDRPAGAGKWIARREPANGSYRPTRRPQAAYGRASTRREEGIGGFWGILEKNGAGDAIRTRDIFLGKEVLYQLSYTRIFNASHPRSHRKGCQVFFSGLGP